MYPNSFLHAILLIPVPGSAVIAAIPDTQYRAIHRVALYTSLTTLIISVIMWIKFDRLTTTLQFVQKCGWIPFANIDIYMGVDGISLFFILLTTLLIPTCILLGPGTSRAGREPSVHDKFSSLRLPHAHIKEYMICFLLIEVALILVSAVLDPILFYIFFESIPIPMSIIIGIWGSRERKIGAAYQSFLYTLLGSVFSLIATLVIYFETGTTDVQILLTTQFPLQRQLILWLAFFASPAVKVPMIPVHTWLPEAHVEAPTAGSVILAGVLLKLGGYGFLRSPIPMFPEASNYFSPMIFVMSVIAVIYASPTTLRQVDLKKIIAYSSVAHMAFVTLGIFTHNIQAIEGSILLMLSHGVVSSALFMCVGVLYDRHKTRIIKYYSGLIQVMPLFSTLFPIFTPANLSLPTTGGSIGESLVLVGVFQVNKIITLMAALGMVLGAAYSIWLWNRISCGNVKIHFITAYADINPREPVLLLPPVALTPILGIYPEIISDALHASARNLIV